MKTQKEWDESGLNFSEFVAPLDEVDEELYYYFMEVVPTQYNEEGLFQSGEPYTHKDGIAQYFTFRKQGEHHYYLGVLPEF